MSEHDGTDDPYRVPGTPGPLTPGPGTPGPGTPGPLTPAPRSGDADGRPTDPSSGSSGFSGFQDHGPTYGSAPYGSAPYGGPTYGNPAYGNPAYGADAAGRPPKPPSVVRLVQVMLAGAVAALLQGVYALFVVDDVVAESAGDLEQVAVDSGMDPERFAEVTGDIVLVLIAVSAVIAVGLWLLFARLFDRGSGRVAGTVLGALNGAGLLFGLLAPDDLLGWALTAIEAALVVTALVLLWRPATSAWFGAVAASRGR